MYKSKKFLSVIPARGGSKRLPKKNILPFAGRPLIAWSIEAARASKYIDRVIVSTDDLEIAEISAMYGADVPFLRPKEYSTDDSNVVEAVIHLISNLDEYYDYVVLLQPTSPLRKAYHVDEAIELLVNKDAKAVISVSEPFNHCDWLLEVGEKLSLSKAIKEKKKTLEKRSQNLKKKYLVNGAIYICLTEELIRNRTFYIEEKVYAYIMNRMHSIDIDTMLDFRIAEFLFQN